jgi:hypothetical protein
VHNTTTQTRLPKAKNARANVRATLLGFFGARWPVIVSSRGAGEELSGRLTPKRSLRATHPAHSGTLRDRVAVVPALRGA